MEQQHYDIILGQSLDAFGLDNFLAGSSFAESVTIDADARTGRPAFQAHRYTWHLDDLDARSLLICCDFGSQGVLLADGQPLPCQHLRLRFRLLLRELLTPGATNWVEALSDPDEGATDEVAVFSLRRKLKEQLADYKAALTDLILKPGRSFDQALHPTVTSSVVFGQKNDADLRASYLCIGQMLDQRQAPAQPEFPVELMQDAPPVIFRLSTYAYLKLGLHEHLAKAHPNASFVFNEAGTQYALAAGPGQDIILDPNDLQLALESDEEVDFAAVTDLSFALNNSFVTVACSGRIETYRMVTTFGTPSLFLPDPLIYTHYELDTKSFFELVKRPDGVIDVVENQGLRQQRNAKYVDGGMALVVGLVEDALQEMVLDVCRFILPVAAFMAVANPLAGCVLAAVCSATSKLLDNTAQAARTESQLRELTSLQSLRFSFADMFPFQVPSLAIEHFHFADGLVITARPAAQPPS